MILELKENVYKKLKLSCDGKNVPPWYPPRATPWWLFAVPGVEDVNYLIFYLKEFLRI